jgi:uncharacterized repeat protein (TIGR01451 family)
LFGLLTAGAALAQNSIRFTARFDDPQGYADIARATLALGSARCQVEIYPSTRQVDILDGLAWVRTAPASVDSGATLRNDQCSVSTAGSSVTAAGEQLSITLTASINQSSADRGAFMATAWSSSAAAALTPVFTWIDPPARVAHVAHAGSGACPYTFYFSGGLGQGPSDTFLVWTTNPGCQGSATGVGSWFTLGTPAVAGTYNYIPITATENTTGYYQTGTLTFTGTDFTQVFYLNQGVASDYAPNIVSVSPSSGSGMNQVFTIQAFSGDLERVGAVYLEFEGDDNAFCGVQVAGFFGTPSASLTLPSGNQGESMTLPSLENLQTTYCTLNGASSEASGTQGSATIQLSLSFSQAFAGSRYIYGFAEQSTQTYGVYGTWVVPVDPTQPALRISSTHSGNFTQLQTDATYIVTVSNLAGAASPSGTVTVTDALPQGLTLVSMAGSGWSCSGASCTRGDPLTGGNSYPPITVTVDVGPTFPGGGNVVTVSGGGSITLSASDSTNVNTNLAVLSISSSHTGSFTQGQTNATYTLVVSNLAGTDPTSGSVSVQDWTPSGWTLVSMAGSGWTCSGNTCQRSDALNGGSSYPPITVTVGVSPTATSPQANYVVVSGGGPASASATDSTVIVPAVAIAFQSNLQAPFSLEDGSVYQAPTTLYWTIGAQHTVTWLTSWTSLPGALYSFQSWSDGGTNPRTFTVTAPATYTANLQAQYLLTIDIPVPGGTVTANPPSANGYYAADQYVTLTATPAAGFAFAYFAGGGNLVFMTAPETVTAYFGCPLVGVPPLDISPGPLSGLFIWPVNPACPSLGFTSVTPWFTLGTPSTIAGYGVVPYSVPEYTLANSARPAEVFVLGAASPPTIYLGQNGPIAGTPAWNIVSIAPNVGTGSAQVFTVQAYSDEGYATIGTLDLVFTSPNLLTCEILMSGFGATPMATLVSDTGALQQISLPGTGTIANSRCSLDAAGSAFSGAGNLANIQLALSFSQAMAGAQIVSDATAGTILGLWTVPANPSLPGLFAVKTHPSQQVNQGQNGLAFTVTVSNVAGAAPTSGTVTVTDTMPAGLSPVSMSGSDWSCSANSCRRSDSLAAGTSYPAITVIANVAPNAAAQQINVAAISGGGSAAFTTSDTVTVFGPPSLTVQSSHSAPFVIGQTNTYTLQVSNAAAARTTSGTVTVTENLPAGLTLVSMSGSTWTCGGNTCTTTVTEAGGNSFYPITVNAGVEAGAGSPLVNQVSVSGGGSASASATDSTIVVTNPPVLSVSLTNAAPFYNWQTGTFTITVSNQAGAGATYGTVIVYDGLPIGLRFSSISGNGWYCETDFVQCARSDPLPAGSSYPPITLTVGVGTYTANPTLTDQVTVTGGESVNAGASDAVSILPAGTLLVSATANGSFTQAETNATYTIVVSAQSGDGTVFGGASLNESLPAGLTAVSMAGTGWNCPNATSCTRSDNLAAGSSYPTVTATVNVTPTAASPLLYSVTANGEISQATASVSTSILPHAAAVAIQSNVTGAPFSLDNGATYLSPVTFYWPSGVQHTVTWLSAVPGQTNASYTFQDWNDGGSNPRTFNGGTAGTYTANIAAQYQLWLSASPASEGTVTASPSSPTGFYPAGQTVTLTATPNPGFQFTGITGAYFPYTVTMNSPQTVVASFACEYTTYGPLPSALAAGPMSALVLWTSGPGCALSESSSASWLTVGPTVSVDGFNAIPVSAGENTGAAQSANVTFSPNVIQPGSVSQLAAGSTTPNPVSVTPNQGSGIGQIFALQAYDATGYGNIGELDLMVTGTDGSQCRAAATWLGGQSSLYLVGDSGTFLGPLNLPGSGALTNSRCTLNAAGSSVSGSGKYVTVNFSLTFTTAFPGSKYLTGAATDITRTNTETYVLGTWVVSTAPAAPLLTSPANLATGAGLSPSLAWGAELNAASYDVYFGTSAAPQLVGNTTAGVYTPGNLNPGTTYYWQIAARNTSGANASAIWSFTTEQPCSATVNSGVNYSFSSSANGANVAVTAAAGCSWGYSSPVTWATFQSTSGLASGSGSWAFTVSPNYAPTQRSTTITVAGTTLTITQAADLACNLTGDGQPAVADVQRVVSEALGVMNPVNDLNGGGVVNVSDIQIVINAAMGMGCVASGN